MRPLAGRLLACGAAISLSVCEAEVEDVAEGDLALVGERALGPADLQQVQAQLGAYAQTRFRGGHGQRSLLEALIDAELLSQEAVGAGMASDPRVHWALVDEMATLQRNAELERRLPRARVAADGVALRIYYDEHIADFTEPEQRAMEGVRFEDLGEAERALARVRMGEAELGELGEVVRTALARRDDLTFPGFHAILFDPSLSEGDWLPVPVTTERAIVVGRVIQIRAATASPFEDAAVQERLVNAVREQQLEPVRAALSAELAERYPAAAR